MLSGFAPQPDPRKYYPSKDYPSKGNCLKRFTYLARKKLFPAKRRTLLKNHKKAM